MPAPTDLELVTTEDLIHELCGRFEAVAIIMSKGRTAEEDMMGKIMNGDVYRLRTMLAHAAFDMDLQLHQHMVRNEIERDDA